MIKKDAFTIAEFIIAMAAIAVLAVLTLVVTKPSKLVDQKTIRHKYSAVHDALNLAAFSMKADDEANPFILSADEITNGKTNFSKFCSGMADYINTLNENCSAPAVSEDIAFMKDEDVDFRDLTPNLESLTGVKFYFSDIITDTRDPSLRGYYRADDQDYQLSFFMVYVDINAMDEKERNHTIKYDSSTNTYPDVFAFAVIPIGYAIPMGIAEYDLQYLSAKYSYKENARVNVSDNFSYRQAKHEAWGWYSDSGSDMKFIKTQPHTYNEFVKEILLTQNTELYKFNEGGAYPETYAGTYSDKCTPDPTNNISVYDQCGLVLNTPEFIQAY